MSDGGNEYGTIPSLVAKHEVTRAIFEILRRLSQTDRD